MSALHRVKAPAVHDSVVRERHVRQLESDKAVTRTRNAFRDSQDKKQQAKRDLTVADGVKLHSDLIMQRLMRLNKNLWFEVANADKNRYGIYLLDPGATGGRQFICGLPRGMVREYTVVDEDAETGEVTRITPGWRNVLARLVRARLISEPRAVVMFGTPSVTSKRWQDAVA